MRLRLHSLLAIALSGVLVACSSDKPDYNSMSELELYTRAQQEIKAGNLKSGTEVLEAMDKSYPFGPYSQQMQLNLIYAYYKSDNLTLALATVDRFLKLNPTHPNVDWVVYMRGLINMRLDDNMIQNFFNIDRSDRDRAFVMAAFKDFTYLVTRYPNSPYVADADKRLLFIKNRLAKYQLKVATYYSDRGAYVAVINRVTQMLKVFPDTEATKEGLVLMLNAYNKLGLTKEAENVDLLIKANAKNASTHKDKPSKSIETQPIKTEVTQATKPAEKETPSAKKEASVSEKTDVISKSESVNKNAVNSKSNATIADKKSADIVSKSTTVDKKETKTQSKDASLSKKAPDSTSKEYPIIIEDMRKIQEDTIKNMENTLDDTTEFGD